MNESELKSIHFYDHGNHESDYTPDPDLVEYIVRHRNDKRVYHNDFMYPGMSISISPSEMLPPFPVNPVTHHFLKSQRTVGHNYCYLTIQKTLVFEDRITFTGTIGQDVTPRTVTVRGRSFPTGFLYSQYLFNKDGIRGYQEMMTILPTLAGLCDHPHFEPQIFSVIVRDYLFSS
jgi:hypothetical protein